MNVVSRVKGMAEKISDECSLFMIRHQGGYLMMTALLGVLSSDCSLCAGRARAVGNAGHRRAEPARAFAGRPGRQGACDSRSLCVRWLALRGALDGGGVFIGCGGDSWAACQYRYGDLPGLQRGQLYIGRLIHATPSADDRQTDRACWISHG